jgi:hypothetical protein
MPQNEQAPDLFIVGQRGREGDIGAQIRLALKPHPGNAQCFGFAGAEISGADVRLGRGIELKRKTF